MAYQSLLMGDAFGKGFQYGKRKISAMTNEEFNKMSLPNLFRDSMNEYESMIPTVEAAMSNSTKLQNSIIERMLKILPELVGSFFQGSPDTATDSPFLKNQTDVAQNATIQAMQATINNIRYTTDRDTVFNKPAIDELQKQLDKLLEQSGTKAELEEKLNPTPSPPEEETLTSHHLPASAKTLSIAADEEWRIWSTNLGRLKAEFSRLQSTYNSARSKYLRRISTSANLRQYTDAWNKMPSITTQILKFARDYRHPNNNIRENALRLRAAMARGVYKRKAG